MVTEFAPAKVNLTLDVLGRRQDGYHQLESLVAFASIGDTLTLDLSGPADVNASGPFADAIAGTNSLEHTFSLLAAEAPDLRLGTVHLDKQLPVSAGLGGGSANAAALLRAIRRLNPLASADVDWNGLALRLGSDVPVCLAGRAAWMSGRGEQIAVVEPPLHPLPVVLANPLTAVPADKTAQVFRRLAAPALAPSHARRFSPPRLDSEAGVTALASLIGEQGNHLARPAREIMPDIGMVLDELERLTGVLARALSGAGPTCFAVFPSLDAAEAAAGALALRQPQWWVRAATLN